MEPELEPEQFETYALIHDAVPLVTTWMEKYMCICCFVSNKISFIFFHVIKCTMLL